MATSSKGTKHDNQKNSFVVSPSRPNKTAQEVVSSPLIGDADVIGAITNSGFLNGLSYSYYRIIQTEPTEFYINLYSDTGKNLFTVLLDYEPKAAAGGNFGIVYHFQKLDVFPNPFDIPIVETGFFLKGFTQAGVVVANLNMTGGVGEPTFQYISSEFGVFEILNNNRLVLAADFLDQVDSFSITIKATDETGATIEVTKVIEVGDAIPLSNVLINPVIAVDGLPSGRFVGLLQAVGGIAPYTFVLTEDLNNKFEILNDNEIHTIDSLDIADIKYDFDIEVTDSNVEGASVLEKTLTVTIDNALTNTSSVAFNGSDQFIRVPKTDGFNPEWDDAFSITTWNNRPTTNTSDTIFSTIVTSSNNGLGWQIYFDANNSNRLLVHLNNSNGNQIRTRFELGAGVIATWNHIAVTYDGSGLASGINVYLDSVLVTKNVIEDGLNEATILNSDPYVYMSARGNNSQNSDVLLDQTVFFASEISQANVNVMYNSGVVSDLRLNPLLSSMLHGWEWEENLVDVVSSTLTEYVNQDVNSFSTDIP